jgi:hypothetical protein
MKKLSQQLPRSFDAFDAFVTRRAAGKAGKAVRPINWQGG